MGSETPKQFILISGKPILMHTVTKFASMAIVPRIILALPKNQIETWKKLCDRYKFNFEHTIVAGGETRFHSVQNGLQEVGDINSLVAIHDGVRPLVSTVVIENCFRVAELKGNAVPVVKPLESVRMMEGTDSIPVDRNKVFLVQTPQVFKTGVIKKCYDIEFQQSFTDDASVAEYQGEIIHLVEGNRENIKITTPVDLKFAETLIY